jgi:hypothetical protein
MFGLNYSHNMDDDELKKNLYENSCKMIRDRIEEMSDEEKKDLTEQIEEEISSDKLEKLKKLSKVGKVSGSLKAGGTGVLALQGGAVALTGSNLGVCVLLTSGLSSISGAVGIAFPFAAYTGITSVAGSVLAAAGVLSNPVFWAPAVLAAGGAGYHAWKKSQKRQYSYLAGINYLIESKKKLQR